MKHVHQVTTKVSYKFLETKYYWEYLRNKLNINQILVNFCPGPCASGF